MEFEEFEKIVGENGKTSIGREGDWMLTMKVPDTNYEEANRLLRCISENLRKKQYKARIIKGTIQMKEKYDNLPLTKDIMKVLGTEKVTDMMEVMSKNGPENYAFWIGDTKKYIRVKGITMIVTLIFGPESVPEKEFKKFMESWKA